MQVKIIEEYCKGCNLCTFVCPREVFHVSDQMCDRGYYIPAIENPQDCVNWERENPDRAVCERCILNCPDHAIAWAMGDDNSDASPEEDA